MTPPSRSEAESRKLLMSLITRHQRQIFAYVYVLVPNRAAAEDLFQETSLVICEKFEEFEEGTDFVAWACQIAFWRIRQARQQFARRCKVAFDQDVLDAVAQTAAGAAQELDERHDALSDCLGKLHARDRELITTRYEPGGCVAVAAERTGRSLVAAYKALNRVRKMLMDCVTLQMASGGHHEPH
jgi:RNA polymerase sigma-70 factor (ECF subfamily)